MKISSPSFENGQAIPRKYTCEGENINPPLLFEYVPDTARSLVLVVDDPDAIPFAGHVFVHWIIVNVDPKVERIEEGSTPTGALECTTSYGKPGWGGPCPPVGNHRYFFKLYSLDTMLTLRPSVNKEKIEAIMVGHILQETSLVGTYQKVG